MAGAGNQGVTPTDVPGEQVFAVKDCALIAIATGRRAYTLTELRDSLEQVSADSIYFHFWGGLLEPRFEEREYNNDFAAWARHGLHDGVLAERLAMLDPTRFDDLEELRQTLLDLVDTRLDESEYLPWVRTTRRFELLRSQIVVFDTGCRLQQPAELAQLIGELSTSSVFYHFIDARRRQPDQRDDFQVWLSGFGGRYAVLCEQLAGVDPWFESLSELRQQLAQLFRQILPGDTP
ncbi:MAG: DUF5752 family protein [Gammaproteobacteria bacterium]|jgi:hypothetical protein